MNDKCKPLASIAVLAVAAFVLMSCGTPLKAKKESGVIDGRWGLVYLDIYNTTINRIFQNEMRYQAEVTFKNLSEEEEWINRNYFTIRSNKPYAYADPGEYALIQIEIYYAGLGRRLRWSPSDDSRAPTFEIKGGEIIYLGTYRFEAKQTTLFGYSPKILDYSDLSAAQNELAKTSPSLANRMQERLLEHPVFLR